MGIFDTIVKGVGDYLGSDDGDEMIDNFRGYFSDEGERAADDGGGGGDGFGGFVSSLFGDSEGGDGEGGGGGFGGFLNSFLGDSESEGGSGEGGWGGTFGRIVDQLNGDGGRQDLWDRALGTAVDRVSSYLPEELREVAGQYFDQGQGGQGPGGQTSSRSGSLVDPSQTRVPNGWHAVANQPTIGHSYGESGFGGFVDHSIANLAGNYGMQPGYVMSPQSPQPQMGNSQPYDDGIRYFQAPDIEPGQPLGHGPTGDGQPDPRVTMPGVALGRDRDPDTDGDPDLPGLDIDGDGDPDTPARRWDYDADGDGYPDMPGPRSLHDEDGDGYPDGYDARVDYDDLVTSGTPASRPAYQAPHDPTFPADAPNPAAVSGPTALPAESPAVEAPASDFQQSIDDAEQVDQDMGAVFDGLEGPV